MEKNRLHEQQPIPHDRSSLLPEKIALEALVNELFKRSDARVFDILNQQCEEITHE